MSTAKFRKLFLFLFLTVIVSGQDDLNLEADQKKIKVCEYCTCSEIPNEDASHLVLNIQCSELDRIENLPDLDKIEWPENPNSLKITAAFEGLGVSTLGKLPPNTQVEALKFSNNAIKAYWPDPFVDVPNLKKLSFSQNELAEITPDLFTKVNNLEDLDFSYNKLVDIKPLDFKTLHNVKRLNMQSNALNKIPVEALQYMTALEDLDLSKNGIFDLLLQRSNSEPLIGIKRLSLSGNRIRSITKDSFPENNSLELLDISNNIIESIDEDAFLTCTNLKELNLGQNNITLLFNLPSTLQIAIFKQNLIHKWPKFPEGITYIDLSYNRLEDIYEEQVTKFDNLEILNIAGNQIKDLILENKLGKLFNLDISYNRIEDIPKSLNSQVFPNLEELRLDGNPITSIYFKNILIVRNLYMNELSQLYAVDDKAFSNVLGRNLGDENDKNCFSLYLSNCHSLSEIHQGAFDGTSVCMLDISSNNLSTLPEMLLEWNSVSEGVNLQWNPWDCSCDLQWILDELLPSMYERHSRLLAQLRCETPRAVQGLRFVHWYNWTDRVLCDDSYLRSGPHGNFMLESTSRDSNFLTNPSPLTIVLGVLIIISLLVAIALAVYLVKGRKRYRIKQAALKRKRQSALDAYNSNGDQKEPFSALNKA